MNIRKLLFLLTFIVSLSIVVGCNKGVSNDSVKKLDYKITTLQRDTVCMLFGEENGPQCTVTYKLHYAEGKDAAFINDIINARVFPDNDSSSLEDAVRQNINEVVSEYKLSLKGVSKKVLSSDEDVQTFADFERSVVSTVEKVNDLLLVYTVSFHEKAYGALNPVENEYTFNISLIDKKVVMPDDIFVPGYKDRLVAKILKKMTANFRVPDLKGLQARGIYSDGMPYTPDNFIITKDSVIFVYNPNEIAGRQYGVIKITFKYGELKDIMRKGWIEFFDKK